jgi:hypothetical protein
MHCVDMKHLVSLSFLFDQIQTKFITMLTQCGGSSHFDLKFSTGGNTEDETFAERCF